MVLSALAFSILSLFVKAVGEQGIPVLEIVAARSVISIVISYYAIRLKGIPALGHQKGLLFSRGFIGFIALTCVFYGVTHLPLAEATVLQYLHPMFTAVLAGFFLRERPSLGTIICIFLSFGGLLFIVRPDFMFGGVDNGFDKLAITIAIGGAFGSACAYTLVRKLSKTEDPAVIVLYFPLVSLPATIPFLINDFVMPQGITWLYLLAVGITTQIGQVTLTKGIQLETASKATSYSYLQVVFAIVLGVIFYSEIPDLMTLAGAALIISGAYINAVWKTKAAT